MRLIVDIWSKVISTAASYCFIAVSVYQGLWFQLFTIRLSYYFIDLGFIWFYFSFFTVKFWFICFWRFILVCFYWIFLQNGFLHPVSKIKILQQTHLWQMFGCILPTLLLHKVARWSVATSEFFPTPTLNQCYNLRKFTTNICFKNCKLWFYLSCQISAKWVTCLIFGSFLVGSLSSVVSFYYHSAIALCDLKLILWFKA